MAERLTREETRALIGPADDAALAEILQMSADRAELTEALAWIANDEAMLNEGRPVPQGRVARLIEILKTCDEEDLSELSTR
ncbi:hypothetical protein [Microvirga massiliensis]|uniref:hypothetical protein n=1 Tax=Microvirga massiliensis TaxID=1033741 RepID=UPI00062BC2A7|nr:hypothetical protein [Microvirga massiliensis]